MNWITLIILAITLMASSTAIAIVDPQPDQIGIYFDLFLGSNSRTVSAMEPFDVYVVAIKPSADIHEFIFGYRLETTPGQENSLLRIGTIWPGIGTECFSNSCGGANILEDYYIFGLATPLPMADTVTLIRWQFLLLSDFSINFYLTGEQPPETGFQTPAYLNGLEVIPFLITSGSVNLPVATLNPASVSLHSTTFGSLKTLYR